MPENIGDLLHGRAGSQQSARDAVPENMNARPLLTASLVSCSHRPLDCAAVDRRVVRCDMTNEYGTVRCSGPLIAQIGNDRGAGRGGQRESIDAARLGARQAERALGPVDIFEPKVGDLTASEAEVDEAPHHREATPMGPERRIE